MIRWGWILNTALLIAFVTAMVAIWFFWSTQIEIAAHLVGIKTDQQSLGQWGDSFGGLNALFGALGFSAIFSTLIIQLRALARQRDAEHRDRFDQSFFQLLGLLRDVRSEITAQDYGPQGGLKDVFGPNALKTIANDVSAELMRTKPFDEPASLDNLIRSYEIYHSRYEHLLGPYFRVIYTILKRIDEDRVLSQKEKIRYANLLRGQLGSSEVALLTMNGLTRAAKDLPTYLNRYRIPRYLPAGIVLDAVRPHYDPAAFEPRND